MSTLNEVILQQLELGGGLIERFTGDIADAEYFIPAIAGGNHIGWLLGHVARTEDWAVSQIAGTPQRFDQRLNDLFRGGSACTPDATNYPSRRGIDELFRNARSHTREVLMSFDAARWEERSPAAGPDSFFPTLGSLWNLVGTHQFWHIGQITDCRRALQKPALLFE